MLTTQPKYIFMTGGVCSGLGKGLTAASLGRLLKARGYKVTIQKFDPYINRSPGLLSPYEHGEVFVTEDGAEVDLDLGHYERFIDENLSVNNSVSAGKIYWEILHKERDGAYKGKTIQVIPHITDAIKTYIKRAASETQSNIIISEIGGTVGDIESLPFLESIRQVAHDEGYQNVMYIHVALVPYLNFAEEMKTKPAQHSVKDLLSLGIKPDALVCRTEYAISQEMREKLALYCNVDKTCVIENRNVDSIYELPLLLEDDGFADIVCKRLNLDDPEPNLTEWKSLVRTQPTKEIRIALVGKYTELPDAYLSVSEAIKHAGVFHNVKIELDLIHSKEITDKTAKKILGKFKAIIMPGGYGGRDITGLISAVRYARENKVPFLGLGLGMQCAVIEFARNVVNIPEATTSEIKKDEGKEELKNPVHVIEHIQRANFAEEKDGQRTMRLGAHPCKLNPNSLTFAAYNETLIYERFRHLCKINNQHRPAFAEHGLIEAALSPDEQHVEAIELPQTRHPWFVGVQFRPEFKSRINRPSPIFKGFIGACVKG